ncbi:cysteine synthase A [Spirochaeta africana]|uniref:Cysteine synthase n=1 Tax=Spirochaeta africana (strain ATCC 700263 / DSM 8902 / Z-7692) TaxID=889378 RepID=H9UKQ0_SPIAZ|nr:cysteine synthase A [Spirochaeta africana]AFG38093.1 cysteine synthase A [Spirochaeta africana DSM 8902]
MGIYNSMTELVGRTPMVRLQRLAAELPGEVVVKLESGNPTSSVKDRTGLGMIEAAEASGELPPGGTIIEATSGNTGIALAFVGAVKGYRVMLTMPDTMSIERRRLLKALGATLVLTPGPQGMNGAVAKAEELVRATPGAVLTRQFTNPANPQVHRDTTAGEIWHDCDQKVDILVAGVGTGGSITGIGEVLRQHNPDLRIVAVEPESSAVLSGGSPGPHRIQGIGAGFVPDVLNTGLLDEVIPVGNDAATETARELAKREGILGGVSSGANVWAALQIAARPESAGKRIVTFICDSGERYLSTWLYDE